MVLLFLPNGRENLLRTDDRFSRKAGQLLPIGVATFYSNAIDLSIQPFFTVIEMSHLWIPGKEVI